MRAHNTHYLRNWESRFWIDADEVSRVVISEISDKLAANLGVEVGSLQASLEALQGASYKEKRQLKSRAQPIVSNLQLREHNETISALAELIADRNCEYFLLIDDLDRPWVSDDLQYPLIRALIDSLQTFGRIPEVRIVMAIREDLFEAVMETTAERHFQPEKLEGLVVRVRWPREQLRSVLEARIRYLFRRKYTKADVRLGDVSPDAIRGERIEEFLIRRTLRRPRDIIAFANKVLERNALSILPLGPKQGKGCESEYSRSRVTALCHEWRSRHPMLGNYFDVLSSGGGSMTLADFHEERLFSLIVEVDGMNREAADEVERLASIVYERNKYAQVGRLARERICCLYKVGAIGVKVSSVERYRYSFTDDPVMNVRQLSEDSKVVVVPMLSSALGKTRDAREAA